MGEASVRTLTSLVQDLALARERSAVTEAVRRSIRQLVRCDGATFVLKDGEQSYYVDEDAIGPLFKGQRFPLDACIGGWVIRHREPAIVLDVATDPRIPCGAYERTFVKSLLMVPIRSREPVGAIGAYWAERHDASADEVEALQAVADCASVALENVALLGDLERRYVERTAELEAANRELELFAGAAAHDLRGPLMVMLGNAELLKETLGASSAAQKLLEPIIVGAIDMNTLLDHMLRLSRVTLGELHREQVDVVALLREIWHEQRVGPETELVLPPRLEVRADAGLLKLALQNLVSNAIKYSARRPHPRVELREEDTERGAAVVVRDNGVGFDDREAARLFVPFSRLPSARSFQGSGMGLVTAARVVHRHGGEIWAKSRPGQGAAFYFTLGSVADPNARVDSVRGSRSQPPMR
jgi:signal transduction histidine kinase